MNSCHSESLGRLIYKTSLNLRNYTEKLLNPHGLTVEQFHLLKMASIHFGLSQKQMCEHIEKSPANITRIIDRLEKKGWIERKPNPEDRRSALLFLTKEGGSLIEEVSTHFESYSSWFTRDLSQEEEMNFRRTLEKIDKNIEKLMDEVSTLQERRGK